MLGKILFFLGVVLFAFGVNDVFIDRVHSSASPFVLFSIAAFMASAASAVVWRKS